MMDELRSQLAGLELGSHLCLLDEDLAQQLTIVRLYIEDGHEQGDQSSHNKPAEMVHIVCQACRNLNVSRAEIANNRGAGRFGSDLGTHSSHHGWHSAPIVAGDGRSNGVSHPSDSSDQKKITASEAILVQLAHVESLSIENARLREQVRAGHEQRKSLSRELLEVQEAERRHLARELHDEVGQALTGLRLLLRTDPNPAIDMTRIKLKEAKGYVDELLSKVRELSFDLRPAALDQFGLLPALLALFDRFGSQTGVHVSFEHERIDRRFESSVESTAYRIVQESLTNVARHARVDTATVRVWIAGELMYLQIEDRGRGFEPVSDPTRTRSSGLAGMRERVMLLGGDLTIDSSPETGTLLTSELPLKGLASKGNHDDYHYFGR